MGGWGPDGLAAEAQKVPGTKTRSGQSLVCQGEILVNSGGRQPFIPPAVPTCNPSRALPTPSDPFQGPAQPPALASPP